MDDSQKQLKALQTSNGVTLISLVSEHKNHDCARYCRPL